MNISELRKWCDKVSTASMDIALCRRTPPTKVNLLNSIGGVEHGKNQADSYALDNHVCYGCGNSTGLS